MAVYTWNTTSGSFATGSNWTPAGPPGTADTATFATEAQCQEFLSSPGGQISAAELKGLLARADQPVAAELTCVAAGDPA